MLRHRALLVPALLVLALAGAAGALWQVLPDDPPPALPARTPIGSIELVSAQPFLLDRPYVNEWRAERPLVDAGVLVVLAVDPALVHPRQTAEPILYAGAQTAERVNVGHLSGRVVAVVPAARDGRGGVALDWSAMPFFFGEPGLPEQVDAAKARAELAAARAEGIAPPGAAQLQAAVQATVRFPSRDDLHLYASDLVEAHSPQEVDLIAGLRAPRLGG